MMKYPLTPFSGEPRIAVSSSTDAPGIIDGFTTVCTHSYQVVYNPGSLRRVDDPTTGAFHFNEKRLRLNLTMTESQMALVMDKLAVQHDFLKSDFVSLNFISADNRIAQVMVKPDGAARLIDVDEEHVTIKVRADEASWTIDVAVDWNGLGLTAESFKNAPLPFDVVRFQGATGVVTSWATLPDQLPFNDPYAFPVFRFGLLSAKPIEWDQVANVPVDLGTLEYVGPTTITVGSFNELEFVYTLGEHGLAPGGAILFNVGNEVIECNRRSHVVRHLPEKDWSPPQWDDPVKPGFTTASCSREGVAFTLERERHFSVTARHTGSTPLEPGDVVRLSIGTVPECPGIRAQLLSQRNYPFKFHVDPLGNGAYLPLAFPTVNVVGRQAVGFVVHALSTPEPDETFTIKVVAVDAFGNIAESHVGEFALHSPLPLTGLPELCRFEKSDQGVKRLDVSVAAKGTFMIQAIDAIDSCVNGESELIVTDGRFGPGKIVFGDIHTHTRLSDGRLHPFEKRREVADHRGLDFWAITDHDHDLTEERFELLKETVERFDQPGEFVVMPAYEWSPNMGQQARWDRERTPGHRNVLFNDPPKRIVDGVRGESDTPATLKATLERDEPGNHLIVSHFHCGDPAIDPNVDDCVEISGWCNGFHREFRGERNDIGGRYCVQDAYGMRSGFGVTAGTDHGTEAYYTGLPAEMTAVRCARLDRKNVFEALKGGEIYASSGQRVLLKFTVNGAAPRVGSEPIPASDSRNINIVVGSAKPVVNVIVVRNGDTLKTFPGFHFGVETYSLSDDDPLESGYYYVRVHTAQGHATWSSPVWFGSGKNV